MVYSALKGRIGNNLFQIAAGLSLARKNNTQFAAHIRKFILPEPDNCFLSVYLNQFRSNILRNVVLLEDIPEDVINYKESGLSFCPIKYQHNIVLDGYFQSEKYFDKKLIRELFSIDKLTDAFIRSKYDDILLQEITSINVRRGDFTAIPQYHPVCSITYYRNAIKYIGADKLFMVISDDIVWCKKKFKGDNFYFVEDENPAIDLYLQSLCTNNIISNSSFSWWGAWLNSNPDKIVIAPSENWVGKLHPLSDTQDLLPGNWVKLSNPLNYSSRIKVFHTRILQLLNIRVRLLKKILTKSDT